MSYGVVILLVGIAFFLGYLWGSQRKFSGKNPLDQIQPNDMATAHLTVSQKQEIQRLMQQNNKIEAIKQYREIMGCGLREAKEAVERMQL